MRTPATPCRFRPTLIAGCLLLAAACGDDPQEATGSDTAAGSGSATGSASGSGSATGTGPSTATGASAGSSSATGGSSGSGSSGGSGTTGGLGTTGGAGTTGGSGTTGGAGTTGGSGTTGGAQCNGLLPVTIRDFHASHPDFEAFLGTDPGIVLEDLGMDDKPVYAGQAGNPTTTGQANFDQWHRDVPGVNTSLPKSLQLNEVMPGFWEFDDQNFFPIDGEGFGDEGNAHNYHFTLELHSTFEYIGGETFTFRGDDDVFVFLNGKLAIDLGGVHGPLEATVDLDAQAAALGITPGNTYSLDLFFAERHTTQSSFRIQTTIACFLPQ